MGETGRQRAPGVSSSQDNSPHNWLNRALREDALDQADMSWIDWPCPLAEYRKPVTGKGAQPANPALRFGVQQGKRLRAASDLKSS